MNMKIYNAIKARILSLQYPPGTILNEKNLAAEFNVSRTPLRAVLSRLEADELVRVLPRTGTMVTEIEFQKIMHTFQVRLGIDEMIGTLAADHVRAETIEQLLTLREQCRTLLDNKNRSVLLEIDREFKKIMNESTDNPVLTQISEALYNHTSRLWGIVLEKGDWNEEVQSVYDEISLTITALQTNDQELGKLRRQLLMKHIERIRAKFIGA